MVAPLLCLALLSPALMAQDDRNTHEHAVIIGTTAPRAIEAGLQVMRDEGGSAVDGAMTTALAQTAIAAGCWVSYAGRMTLMYYEAETGRVYALNACYNAPLEEDDPKSIPRPGTPSGRTAMTPGFMAGVQAAHDRFGRVPFKRLFDPSIEIADEGITLTNNMAGLIRRKGDVLTRYAEGRAVFLREDGELYQAGDLFKQPELARTLRGVAEHGAQYMYTGEWGENFVRIVRREGGKITGEDMRRYQPTWQEPITAEYGDSVVYCLPGPNLGGTGTVFSLNVLGKANFNALGNYRENADALSVLLKTDGLMRMVFAASRRARYQQEMPGVDFSMEGVATKATANAMWERFVQPQPPAHDAPSTAADDEIPLSEHSDSIVAVDAGGNVVALIHTINTGGWGTTGLFVDGVSIPDSASTQQSWIEEVGPGGRVHDHGVPTIVLRDGKPLLACSATGSGNVSAVWQNIFKMLEHDMTPTAAANTPNVYGNRVQTDQFPASMIDELRALGVNVEPVDQLSNNTVGYWVGVRIDPATGRMTAGKINRLNGIAAGY